MNRSTYIIKKSLIEKIFTIEDYVATVENAFKLYGLGKVQMPSKVYLYFEKGDLRCMPVYIPSLNIAGVKNVNVHPGNRDIPSVMATITLFDPEDGFPMAVMDGTYITKMRTGAAGGVAAKYLSRQDSKTAGFIGAGEQARTQLAALLAVRPEISEILVYDITRGCADDFVNYASGEYKIKAVCAASVEEAAGADIVTTTTPVRSPVVMKDHIRNGTHINAIGADAKGKQELDPDILKNARVIIDNWEQASHSGEINVALSAGTISKKDIFGDIGEVVTGKKTGRESADDITIFDSTGLAVQDISSAVEIYKRLMDDRKLRKKIEKIDFI